jgi:hypothetical protein
MQLRMARGRGSAPPTLTVAGTPVTTATQGSVYAGFTVAGSGGTPPYTYSVTAGTLPTGLTLDASSGAVSGTPSGTGTSSGIVLRVTDSLSQTADLASFSIAVSAAGNLTITDPTTNANSPYTSFAPVYRDAFIVMSPSVTQNDEAIDVQAVCGTPYSPTATSVTFSGTDVQWFDKITGGKLVFKSATRASVPRNGYLTLSVAATNANGASESSTLSIWVPAIADERFISFVSGSNSNDGKTPGAPWKYCPGTVDWAGTATTDGKTFIFEGGYHETALVQNGYPTWTGPDNTSSNAAKPHRYAWHGWKGQAKLTGGSKITNTWSAAASGDVYASPDLANIEKVTISPRAEIYQIVQFNGARAYVSQYPRPNKLAYNESPQKAGDGTNNYNDTTGTSDGGMKRLIITTNSSDSTPVRFYLSPTGASSYIQDAKLDPRFNNANLAYNANGNGMWLKIWGPNNNVSYIRVLQYDVSLHRVYFDAPSSSLSAYPVPDGYTAYALVNSPYDVQVSGQYACSPDGLTLYAHRPNTGQAWISRRPVAVGIGQVANVVHHQLWTELYCGGPDYTDKGNDNGGQALFCYSFSSPAPTGVRVYGCRAHQNQSMREDPVGLYAFGNLGMDNPILDRLHASECGLGGITKAAAPMYGLTTGSGPGGYPTRAEVLAHPTGKYRWGYVDEYSASRSLRFWTKVRGFEFRENVVRNFNSVHGDGDAWYMEVAGTFTDHNVVVRDFGDCVLRWKTTSIDDSYITSSLSNWLLGCVVLADPYGNNNGIMEFSGDPGGNYESCIFVNSSNSPDTTNIPCLYIAQGFANLTANYCIMNGIGTKLTSQGGVAPSFTIDHCGNTGAAFAADNPGANQRYTNNTTLTTQHKWDGATIPTPWKSILQAGQAAGTVKIGPFWTV